MRKLLYLFIAGCLLASCVHPQLTSEFLSGTWVVDKDTCVKYTFVGKSTMYIDNQVEGEQYEYRIVSNMIAFAPVFDDEIYGDTLLCDTLNVVIDDFNTMGISYLSIDFKLIRKN